MKFGVGNTNISNILLWLSIIEDFIFLQLALTLALLHSFEYKDVAPFMV